ncbi:MAG: A24 family peptidase [Candidatus Eisenbacteria bacterium]|nr:prepilin peptidase [Candidatus Eisenbacteria bacterium]
MPDWTRTLPAAPLFFALLGLCFGSFLNVVIYRLPRGESLWRPGSHCPSCGAAIQPWQNVPVGSYVALRGRCGACRAPIPLRYPVVELLGGVAILAAAALSPDPGAAVVRSVFLLAMLAIAWIDYDHRIIPDVITLPGIVAGIAVAPLLGVGRLQALFGAALGAGILLALALAYRALRKVEGMGMGDVKMAAMVGAFLGPGGVLLTLFFGSMLGSAVGIALLSLKRIQKREQLPFGTFLAAAAAVAALVGPRIWAWYRNL